MNSDDEFEVENDRSRLLTTTNGTKIKLHEDVARYVLSTSENESCHGEILGERCGNCLFLLVLVKVQVNLPRLEGHLITNQP